MNDPLRDVSIDNLLQGASRAVSLPPEYMQPRVDTLAQNVGGLLSALSNVLQRPDRVLPAATNAASSALAPTMPLVGQGISLEELANITKSKESSGNYAALNKQSPGNTASGAYQYTDSTWNGYGGYAKAMLAPPEVQDRRFSEDLQKRVDRFGGDPFKVIAAHYLPALANDPSRWNTPFRFKSGKTVKPVAEYVRYVVKGTPLEEAFNDYIKG